MKPVKIDLDIALEEVAQKVRPTAAVYTVSPSRCLTENCNPQCDCCSDSNEGTCGNTCIVDEFGAPC